MRLPKAAGGCKRKFHASRRHVLPRTSPRTPLPRRHFPADPPETNSDCCSFIGGASGPVSLTKKVGIRHEFRPGRQSRRKQSATQPHGNGAFWVNLDYRNGSSFCPMLSSE